MKLDANSKRLNLHYGTKSCKLLCQVEAGLHMWDILMERNKVGTFGSLSLCLNCLILLVGAYLLYISWADRQVLGSPFKVTVLPPLVSTDAVALSSSATTQSRGGGGGGDGSVDLIDSSSRVVRETARETMTSRSAAAAGVCQLELEMLFQISCFFARPEP